MGRLTWIRLLETPLFRMGHICTHDVSGQRLPLRLPRLVPRFRGGVKSQPPNVTMHATKVLGSNKTRSKTFTRLIQCGSKALHISPFGHSPGCTKELWLYQASQGGPSFDGKFLSPTCPDSGSCRAGRLRLCRPRITRCRPTSCCHGKY